MKKLAVFFPGIGYTIDKPLLYFSRRLAADAGFEVLLLPFSGFPKKVRGDHSMIDKCCRIALAQSKELLAGTDFSLYDHILFVAKSIGTVVSAQIAAQSPAPERTHTVLYTPLEQTFGFKLGDAVCFTGSADPWVKEGIIPELCLKGNISCHVIPGANHSLETQNVKEDIKNLNRIMSKTKEFIYQI